MPQITQLQIENSRKELEVQITKCLLISEDEKQNWLSKIDQLPITTIQNLLQIFQNKNSQMEDYVKTALINDPDQKILQSFKKEILTIKNTAFELEHSGESKKADVSLEKSLKQI